MTNPLSKHFLSSYGNKKIVYDDPNQLAITKIFPFKTILSMVALKIVIENLAPDISKNIVEKIIDRFPFSEELHQLFSPESEFIAPQPLAGLIEFIFSRTEYTHEIRINPMMDIFIPAAIIGLPFMLKSIFSDGYDI